MATRILKWLNYVVILYLLSVLTIPSYAGFWSRRSRTTRSTTTRTTTTTTKRTTQTTATTTTTGLATTTESWTSTVYTDPTTDTDVATPTPEAVEDTTGTSSRSQPPTSVTSETGAGSTEEYNVGPPGIVASPLNLGEVVGIPIALLVIAAIVGVVVFIVVRRQRNVKKPEPTLTENPAYGQAPVGGTCPRLMKENQAAVRTNQYKNILNDEHANGEEIDLGATYSEPTDAIRCNGGEYNRLHFDRLNIEDKAGYATLNSNEAPCDRSGYNHVTIHALESDSGQYSHISRPMFGGEKSSQNGRIGQEMGDDVYDHIGAN